ncbi:hypothetical protein HQ576_16365, partial [bacterium]|nr:hypothetical protein [bacterium]
MTGFRQRLAAVVLAAWSATAWAGSTRREPQIGYVFPAGGQQGTTFEIAVGGQLLRGVKRVCVSGEGVRAEIIKHYRPSRNLQKEQRDKLRSLLKELKEKQLASLKAKSTARVAPAPAKKPSKADTSKGKSQAKGKAAEKERGKGKEKGKGKGKGKEEGKGEEKEAKLPEHPLLRNLESKNLRELYLVAEGFFNFAKFRMKQPNSQLAEVLLVRVT